MSVDSVSFLCCFRSSNVDGAQLFSVGKSVLLSLRFRRSAGFDFGASYLEWDNRVRCCHKISDSWWEGIGSLCYHSKRWSIEAQLASLVVYVFGAQIGKHSSEMVLWVRGDPEFWFHYGRRFRSRDCLSEELSFGMQAVFSGVHRVCFKRISQRLLWVDLACFFGSLTYGSGCSGARVQFSHWQGAGFLSEARSQRSVWWIHQYEEGW